MGNASATRLLVCAVLAGALAAFGSYGLPYTGVTVPESANTAVYGATVALWIIFALLGLVILDRPFHAVRLLMGLFLAAIIAGLGYCGLRANKEFAEYGQETRAIASHRVHHVTNLYSYLVIHTHTEDSYTLDYTFNVGGKSYGERDVQVTKTTWDNASTNPELLVRYTSDNPAVSVIEQPGQEGNPGYVPWAMFGAAGVVLLFTVSASKRTAAQPSSIRRNTPMRKRAL